MATISTGKAGKLVPPRTSCYPQGSTLWAREVALARYLSHPVPGDIAGPPGPRGTQILGTGPPGWGLGAELTPLPR
jgi:hypothetical protein